MMAATSDAPDDGAPGDHIFLNKPHLILYIDDSAQVLNKRHWVHLALANACILATGCSATTYTNSQYECSDVHDFGNASISDSSTYV